MARSLREVIGPAYIAGGIMVMNVTTYGLTLATARVLGPTDFGEFSSILGALIIINVLSLGLQTAGARRLAHAPERASSATHEVLRATLVAAATILLGGVLLAPLLTDLLHLESIVSALALASAAALLTVMGGMSGVLQGEERWFALSTVYMAMGVSRLGFGLIALSWAPSARSVSVAVACAAGVPVLVGAIALRHRVTFRGRAPVTADPDPEDGTHGLVREVAHNSHALLAFFVLSNLDVVLGRVLLPPDQAGLYAAGLVLTKAVLFLPQFVIIVAFPAMARRGSGRRTHTAGVALVLAIGAAVTLAVALLSPLALEFVGGPRYVAIQGSLTLFAAVGTVLAMIQVLVYSSIAGRHRRTVWALWVATGIFLAIATTVNDAAALVVVKLTMDALLLGALAAYVLTRTEALAVNDYEPAMVEDPSSPEQPPVR